MPDDTTKLVISLDLILRNLEKTLRGLSQVEKQLQSVASIKVAGTANLDKAALSAQKLSIQAQELANKQERARQTTDRLALSQLRLEKSFANAAKAEVQAARAKETATNRAIVTQERAIRQQERSIAAQIKAQQSILQAQRADRAEVFEQARRRQEDNSKKAVTDAKREASEIRRINAQTAAQAQEQEAIRAKAAKTIADVQVREAQRGADELAKGLAQGRVNAQAFAKQMEGLGNSLRSIGQGLTSVGFTLSATLTAPLVALGVASTQASVTLDSLKRGLTAITGSSEEAGRQLQRLTEIAKLPGIGFEEAIQGSIRLQAVGFSARDAEKALREFSNAIALTGGGRAELERVTIQLGQLAAKGKVLSQDLRPIIEAAPAVGTALKQAFGTVNADDIAQLSGSSENFLKILTEQLEQLPRAAGGARNAFENFRDSVFRASTALGDVLLPILTKLADVALPVIETVANAFRKLPFPIQATVVVVGAFLAALGPVLIVLGQLTVGVGRLAVGLAQMKLQAGEAATSMEALALATAEARVATAGFANTIKGLAGPIGVALTILAILLPEILRLNEAEEKSIEVNEEAAKATNKRVQSLQNELKFLEGLGDASNRTADEQERLNSIYKLLSTTSQNRIRLIDGENAKLAETIRLLREEIALDEFKQKSTTAQLAKNTALALNAQAKAEKDLADAKNQFTDAELAANAELIRSRGGAAGAADRQLRIQQIQNQATAKGGQAQEDLTKATNDTAESLKKLIDVTGLSGDALLQQLRAAGATEEAIKKLKQALDDLAKSEQNTATAIVIATDEQVKQLEKLRAALKDDPNVVLAKTGEEALKDTLESIKAVTSNTEDAARALQNYIEQFPQLKDAVDRAGGVKKAVADLFKVDKSPTGTSLRSAQERLQEQLSRVAQAIRDKQLQEEQAANDQILRDNEISFRKRLISYREYLTTRAELTSGAIDKEIERQKLLVKDAEEARDRLLKAATTRGIPVTERFNRQAQAAQFDEKAIKAQTELKKLEGERKELIDQTTQALAEQGLQQDDDIRRLQIESAKLRGNLENALKSENAERFINRLQELSTEQSFINNRLNDQNKKLTADERDLLEIAQRRNKTETDLILKLIRQGDALAVLSTAEEAVSKAKEKQQDLEDELRFQVEFRGKRETEAIAERLKGEEQLKRRLTVNRDIVQDEINALTALGRDVPEAMTKFVERMNRQLQGLGELSFTEQFRLAEDEFNRLQDELRDRIAQVELAVRHRDLAEIQGRILIKKLNGEYVADLERQAAILEEIAAKSGKNDLIQQAAAARQTAAETRAATTEVAEFGKSLRSVSIDALQEGFADFFRDLTDRTKTAQEKLLGLLDNVAAKITDFAAQRLSEKLIESLFGTPDQQGNAAGGLIAGIKRVFGFGGGGGTKAIAQGADVFGTAGKATEGATAAAALTTGATTAGAAMAAGGTTAGTAMATGSVAFTTAITTAAAGFATAVISAGAAFAAAVAAGSAAQAVGSAGSSIAGAFAATGMFPATPGGLVRIVEGGFDEAVLTTDPAHAAQQVRILQQFLSRTKGLYGRIQGFADGGIISAREAEMNMLASLGPRRSVIPAHAPVPQLAAAGGQGSNVRILNLIDRRHLVGGHLRSAEGTQDVMNLISANSDEIGRRLRIK